MENTKSVMLLEKVLAEQRKTNQLLLMMIEAMAEEDIDMPVEPMTHLDGTPVNG